MQPKISSFSQNTILQNMVSKVDKRGLNLASDEGFYA